MTISTAQEHPWSTAAIRIGTVPQQAILFPRPVILECDRCLRKGYWYPGENSIAVQSNLCDPGQGQKTRAGHSFGHVLTWNLNTPIPGVITGSGSPPL